MVGQERQLWDRSTPPSSIVTEGVHLRTGAICRYGHDDSASIASNFRQTEHRYAEH